MNKKISYRNFIKKARSKYGEKYQYCSELSFDCLSKKIKIICPIHGEFEQTPKYHLSSLCGCPKCSYDYRASNFKLTTEEFIEKAKKVHGDKYDYSGSEYVGTKNKILIVCPIHGEFWQIPNDHLNGKGCPKCNDSKLEKYVEKELKNNGIAYIRKYHARWLKKYELDFYLPEYNVAIECQGKHHVGLGGWSENYDFNIQYFRDSEKNRLCQENGVKLFYFFEKCFFNFKDNFEIYDDKNSFCEFDDVLNKLREM